MKLALNVCEPQTANSEPGSLPKGWHFQIIDVTTLIVYWEISVITNRALGPLQDLSALASRLNRYAL